MSSPDLIDERFDELVRELRAARPEASAELRDRVRQIVTREVAARPRPRTLPRLRWVLAPAVAAAVAGAVAVAIVSSGDDRKPVPATGTALREAAPFSKSAEDQSALSAATGVPAPERGRAQLYVAQITLRVRDLSGATKEALRLTRSLGGHVRSIDYGRGARRGTAMLVLRVPVGHVQQAIAGYNELGRIIDQHVAVRDLQPALDRRFTKIQALRVEIAKLAGDSSLDAAQRRAQLQAELAALQRVQEAERVKSRFATVSVNLRTRQAAAAVPARPGRIERALDRAADVVVAEVEVILYALLVAAPFLLLGVGVVLGGRALRRRADARLLL
jgi:hypothetical protein